MGMKLSVGGGEAEYEVPPVGTHKAICYRVVDAGTAEEEYQGEKKNRHQIYLFWELPECKMSDGRPMGVMTGYTASLNEKSKLYRDVTAWINRSFTQAEKDGFDPSTLCGKGCKVSIEHTATGRAKVVAVHTAPNAFDENDNLRQLPTVNEQKIFDLEEYCKEFSGESSAASKAMCDIFDELPAFLRYRIAGCDEIGREPQPPCFELQAAIKRGDATTPVASKPKTIEEPAHDPFTDDDIPF